VSAARPSGEVPRRREMAPPPADIARLRARRRDARRRRRLARVDLGLGVAGALVLLIATPGLAISGLLAGVVLAACVASFVVERRRRKRPEQRGGKRPAGR
jgi:Flp pilus assembly protein TadB